jgi:hypothetical protein
MEIAMPQVLKSLARNLVPRVFCRSLILVLSLCLTGAAFAHGEADWIMKGQYKDRNGVHCCSPGRDCLPVEAGEVIRIVGGWKHVPTDTVLMDGDPGIHESEDREGRWFRCVRGEMKCLFPRTGT